MAIALDPLPRLRAADLPAVTRAQMREVDRLMVEEYGIQLTQMMENAGLHLADLVRRYLGPPLRGRRVVVLAGQGNNGGGGLVAARRLSAWGAEVEVLLAARPDEYREVPAVQLGILQQMAVPARQFERHLPPHDILVDAVIGYGLEGPPRGGARELIVAADVSPAPTISLDTPSGLDVDTGKAVATAIRAAATLTLALPKVGLLQSGARAYVGELFLADISVPPGLYARLQLRPPALFADGSLVGVHLS
jgi:NAD(P)H-hydrate epimerase